MDFCPRCKKSVNTRICETTIRKHKHISYFCEECGITISSSKIKVEDIKLYNNVIIDPFKKKGKKWADLKGV